MKNRQHQLHLSVLALSLVILSLVATTANAVEFPEKVNQFLSTYCVYCHGPDKQKGKLRLDTLSQDLVAGPHADDWHEVLDALSLEGDISAIPEPSTLLLGGFGLVVLLRRRRA